MKSTIRLIAFLLLSAPVSYTAWAQGAQAPENEEALMIELALETPEGYKPISLAQIEAYLHSLRKDIESTNHKNAGQSPAVLVWDIVRVPIEGGVIYGLLARYQDGSTSVSWVTQNSEQQWVLDAEGRTTFCGSKSTEGQFTEKTSQGCCTATQSGPSEGFCRSTSECGDCLKSSSISVPVYEHKAFR
ncbi:hypothetical protein GC167_10455 [bacterium]|nr:hypothetical protein [bacterium]